MKLPTRSLLGWLAFSLTVGLWMVDRYDVLSALHLHPTQLASYRYQPPRGAFEQLIETPSLALTRWVDSPASLARWQDTLRNRFIRELKLETVADSSYRPAVRQLLAVQRAGYTERKFEVALPSGEPFIAWLLLPAAGPVRRGVVVVPGHGVGAAGVLGHKDDYQEGIARDFIADGLAVVVPEPVTYGELALPRENTDPIDPHAQYGNFLLEIGRPLISFQTAQVIAAKRMLQTQVPSVQSIGAVGISMGGRLAALAAAVERDIAVVVAASGITSSLAVSRGYDDPHDQIPGLLAWADYPDLVALNAPRPLELQYGKREGGPYWVEARSQTTYRYVRRAYQFAGYPNHISQIVHKKDHYYDRSAARAFLRTNLPAQ